jgi:SAM-dependent methyltransferase
MGIEDFLLLTFGTVILLFGFVVFCGAPYLPILGKQKTLALDMLDLKPGQTLVELGSGDGRVLAAAAERGAIAIGYELNPLLVLYSKVVTRKYGKKVKVIWGNFWRRPLPECDAIFTFLLQKYMTKLDKKIIQETRKPVKLISFAFYVPDKPPIQQTGGMYLYEYDESRSNS